MLWCRTEMYKKPAQAKSGPLERKQRRVGPRDLSISPEPPTADMIQEDHEFQVTGTLITAQGDCPPMPNEPVARIYYSPADRVFDMSMKAAMSLGYRIDNVDKQTKMLSFHTV